ncbi:ATP synthase epsilon chain 2 [uncultured Gammaproteobacteria bacterium]
MKTLRLVVATPTAVVVDAEVIAVRAEDASGHFGVLPGHCEFLTALTITVLIYCDADGAEHFVAVRGGVLTVHGGTRLEVATREAVAGDDLVYLQTVVVTQMAARAEVEAEARTRLGQLSLNLVRQLYRTLRGERPVLGPVGGLHHE